MQWECRSRFGNADKKWHHYTKKLQVFDDFMILCSLDIEKLQLRPKKPKQTNI